MPLQEKSLSSKRRDALCVTRGALRIFVFPKEQNLSFRVYEVHFDNNTQRPDEKIQFLAEKLFCDPVCEYFTTRHAPRATRHDYVVWFKEGVYDAEGEMALYCAQKLNLAQGIERVKFGKGHSRPPRRVNSSGNPDSQKELYNPLVEVLEKL